VEIRADDLVQAFSKKALTVDGKEKLSGGRGPENFRDIVNRLGPGTMAATNEGATLLVSLSTRWPRFSYGAETCGPRTVVSRAQEPPAGARTLEPMSSLNADLVRRAFNASSDKVRIVVLLSPTCLHCRSGHGVVGEVLKKFSSSKLQATLIWEPMRERDSPVSAARQALTVQDARISQGWNENKEVGKLFAETLKLHDIAWDVYLAYEPGIKWKGPWPPSPTFWMHQLEGVNPDLLLCKNPTRLEVEVGKLLHERAPA